MKTQRKFLISSDIGRWLESQRVEKEQIEQYYVKSGVGTQCYYLKHSNGSYAKVTLDAQGNAQSLATDEAQYQAQYEHRLGKKIRKDVSTVYIGEAMFVFSSYLDTLEGLCVLVASFEDDKSMRESYALETLQPFVLKEIDKDAKYDSYALALYVKPMEYSLPKLYEQIDAFEPSNLFFWQVPTRLYVRDGVALIVYKNLRLLNYYKIAFQRKHSSATLHRLRVLLRRTATMLETFSELFSPYVQRFCFNLLLRYHEETKFLRYLYFLDELCATREDAKMRLYSELKSLITQEEMAVTQMLLSKPFVHLIQILTRELDEQEHQQFRSLEEVVKQVVTAELKAFEALVAQTKEGYDEAMLEQLYTALDALQTLLEDFFHLIGDKKVQLIVDELNILFKPLREYRNCKERAAILEYIKTNATHQVLDTDPLLCEHEAMLQEKIQTALKLLRSSTFYI